MPSNIRIKDVDLTKAIFTTGEAATICGVSLQTIIRCVDDGRLGGFRVPGSKFRRIPRQDLIVFMRKEGIPLERIGILESEFSIDSRVVEIKPVGTSAHAVDRLQDLRDFLVNEIGSQINIEFNPDGVGLHISAKVGKLDSILPMIQERISTFSKT